MQRSESKLSRRGFGRLAVAATLGGSAAAATPREERRPETAVMAQAQEAPPDAIAGFDVPMSTEPGFVYRP